jgi:predicted GNAT family N-acyltransferase
MEIRSPANEEEMNKCFRLRWEVLRRAWGQPVGSERDNTEETSFHMMVIDKGNVLATGRAHFNTPEEAQVRWMAVDAGQQGKGLGGKVLKSLEQLVKEKGATRVVLNSRSNAIPFYTAHGYRITGEGPLMFGSIVHVRMEKEL